MCTRQYKYILEEYSITQEISRNVHCMSHAPMSVDLQGCSKPTQGGMSVLPLTRARSLRDITPTNFLRHALADHSCIHLKKQHNALPATDRRGDSGKEVPYHVCCNPLTVPSVVKLRPQREMYSNASSAHVYPWCISCHVLPAWMQFKANGSGGSSVTGEGDHSVQSVQAIRIGAVHCWWSETQTLRGTLEICQKWPSNCP